MPGTDKQITVISSLCEGSSIRSIERVMGIHRDTIMRLGVKAGQGCTALMSRKTRNLECTRLEMDEIRGYIGKKDKHVRPGDDPQLGNVWTFCEIDADMKLVPAFHVTKDRSEEAATVLVSDVASGLKNRVQISTDGKGHPQTDRVYAWIHTRDDPKHPKRHVTALHIPPVVSPKTAVRAAIVQEFREHGKAN